MYFLIYIHVYAGKAKRVPWISHGNFASAATGLSECNPEFSGGIVVYQTDNSNNDSDTSAGIPLLILIS